MIPRTAASQPPVCCCSVSESNQRIFLALEKHLWIFGALVKHSCLNHTKYAWSIIDRRKRIVFIGWWAVRNGSLGNISLQRLSCSHETNRLEAVVSCLYLHFMPVDELLEHNDRYKTKTKENLICLKTFFFFFFFPPVILIGEQLITNYWVLSPPGAGWMWCYPSAVVDGCCSGRSTNSAVGRDTQQAPSCILSAVLCSAIRVMSRTGQGSQKKSLQMLGLLFCVFLQQTLRKVEKSVRLQAGQCFCRKAFAVRCPFLCPGWGQWLLMSSFDGQCAVGEQGEPNSAGHPGSASAVASG